MTLDDIAHIESRCRNGWKFDKKYYVCHLKNCLFKIINIDNTSYLKFTLSYNYQNQIILHIIKFHNTGNDYATSEGLGTSNILFKRKSTRNNILNLIEFTKVLTDDELIRISQARDNNNQ